MSTLFDRDYFLEIVKGNIPKHSAVLKWGRNPDIDTGGFEAIWNAGGSYTGFDATAAEIAETFSSSAADAGTVVDSGVATGGTATTLVDSGADFTLTAAIGDLVIDDTKLIHGIVTAVAATTLTVRQWQDITPAQTKAGVVGPVSGDSYRVASPASTGAAAIKILLALDGEYAEIVEYIILNGATAVDSVLTYLRASRAVVVLAGSAGTNAGAITVRQNVTTANVFINMPIGEGRTAVCAYTIPATKSAYFYDWGASLAEKGAAASVVKLKMRPVGQVFQLLDVQSINSTGSSTINRTFRIPKDLVPQRTDLLIEADSSVNNNAVAAYFDLVLVDD